MSIAMIDLRPSPIAPGDILLQIEAGLSENDNESAKPALGMGVASSKGAKSRFVTLCGVVAAVVGAGLVIGLSLESTRNDSNSQSVSVEQRKGSNSNPARMDESFENGSTEVNNFLCEIAAQIPDNRSMLGQFKTTPSQDHALENLQVCFDGAAPFKSWGSSWYWIRPIYDGEITAEFNEVSRTQDFAAFDIRVSVYEGECGEEPTCMETQGMNDGSLGAATWIAVKGKAYKIRVQHMPGTKFGVVVTSANT
jgi:hypothetical protein